MNFCGIWYTGTCVSHKRAACGISPLSLKSAFQQTSTPPQPYLNEGVLESVLEDWCLPYSGYRLYYASRRQSSPAFALLVEALRYRNRDG